MAESNLETPRLGLGEPVTADVSNMDKYGPSRDAKAQTVFNDFVTTTVNVVPPDMLAITRQLENLMIKETKTWWDNKTLTTYLEKNIVPRGLRLKKRPIKTYSQGFITKWDSALLECSAKLMTYIVEEESLELASMQQEMEGLRTQLAMYKEHKDFASVEQAALEKLDSVENSIMDIKKSKFQRDILDYNKDQVFSWHLNKGDNPDTPRSILRTPRSRSKRRNHPRSRSARKVSFSDPESSQEENTGAQYSSAQQQKKKLTSIAAPSKELGAVPKNRLGQTDSLKGQKQGELDANIEERRYPLRSLLVPR
ncbi:uncharacterized protein LOC130335126 [Hyla sarda]|uniref:uncharacterized protein LOC130335126 n=1 Tax=Hyla sarda TaxID=327740 RepID=UPI0024C45BC5|nr:uncharacterized protein LOC130335126 [Hyla sarda]